jgi:hypothetical protein
MQRYLLVIVVCATLGLAPFFPEPHLFGKLRWVLGGAQGMRATDWFDLLMHGSPFVALIGMALYDGLCWLRRGKPSSER